MAETNSIQDTVKNIMFTGAQLVHLFFDCYMSQRLTDMSSHIHYCMYVFIIKKNLLDLQKYFFYFLIEREPSGTKSRRDQESY